MRLPTPGLKRELSLGVLGAMECICFTGMTLDQLSNWINQYGWSDTTEIALGKSHMPIREVTIEIPNIYLMRHQLILAN